MDPNNLVAQTNSVLMTPDCALKPETMGWLLKDTWLPGTPEEEEFFFMEGLQKDRSIPYPGSWRSVNDCLLSSGIPSEESDPLTISPPGESSFRSPFIDDDDDSWPKEILSIKEEPVETDEEIEVSSPPPLKRSALGNLKVETDSSDELVIDETIAREVADPKTSIVWLTNPCDYQAHQLSPVIQSQDINNQQQVVLAKRQSTRQRKPTYPSDIWSSNYHVRTKLGNNFCGKKMTAVLIPAKTQVVTNEVVTNGFTVTRPNWNRTTTTSASHPQQPPSNVSKILVFAKTRNSLDQVEEANVVFTKDSNDNNSSSSSHNINSNQPEWTAEKKSVFPAKSVLKMNIGTRKKCADHNIKERARRSYIQSRFQDLKEILGLKITSSKLSVLNESVAECQSLQSKTLELDFNWKQCFEQNQALQSKLKKLKTACSKRSQIGM